MGRRQIRPRPAPWRAALEAEGTLTAAAKQLSVPGLTWAKETEVTNNETNSANRIGYLFF